MKTTLYLFLLAMFTYSDIDAQDLFTFEQNQITNNTFALDLNLYKSEGYTINHYIKLWDMGEPKDTLGKMYKYIEFGGSSNLYLIQDILTTKLYFGFGNGNYHSGGGNFYVFENVLLGLDLDYKLASKFNLTISGYSSIHLRDGKGKRALVDRYLWNYTMNYIVSKVLQAGIMFEQYILTETKPYIKITYSKYVWAGPTITLNLLQNKLKFQSSIGVDLIDYIDTGIKDSDKEIKEFYKMKIEYSF